MHAHMPMHTAKIWKKYKAFFLFPEAFLSLNWDKYFALYWCFCVRISFILLLIKWSEMDPNRKPRTLVETFDRANHDSIPGYNEALITLLTYPVSTCTAERSFSGIKRLQTPLRRTGRTMTDERLSSIASLHIHKHKDVIDIDGIVTEFARLKGTHLALRL